MTRVNIRIVFMGTPDFAVSILDKLLERGENIVGVVTAPDKPAGRGKTMQASAVKQFAMERGLKVLQPANLKDPLFLEDLKALEPQLQIVVAFRMLPESVWSLPQNGTVNLHASLLPQYRGAAPINWAIINGEQETGVTTFFIRHEIDTGNIIHQQAVPLPDSMNAGVLHDVLMDTGAQLVCRTVDDIAAGTIDTIKQEDIRVTGPLRPAPKIFKEDRRIDWTSDVDHVYNFIRGLSPYPAAWAEFSDVKIFPSTVKIFSCEKIFCDHNKAFGTIETDGKKYIHIAVAGGKIAVTELQPAGKKRMTTEDFLRGIR